MYAKYVSTASATTTNIIQDIAALLTGAAISSLSTSCDQANTTLTSTVAPGWTTVDTAPTGGGVVVSAPDADGLTTKYLQLSIPGGYFALTTYETWNTATHTGTRSTTSGNIGSISNNAVYTYYIFATPRSVYITGNISSIAGQGFIEFSRDCKYLQGTTYPATVVVASAGLGNPQSGYNLGAVSRTKNLTSAGDSPSSTSVTIASFAPRAGGNAVPTTTLLDASGAAYHEMRSIWVMSQNAGAILGRLYDVVEITKGSGAAGDTFSDGTNTYMIVYTASLNTIAFKMA